MASPVAHSLLAIALARAMPWGRSRLDWRWYAVLMFAAVAPDFDFLPGLLVGDINRLHQGASHSIIAAIVFGGLTWLVLRIAGQRAVLAGVAAALAYASHLLLDVFTQDNRAPYGIPLFWPFSSDHFIAPWSIFSGVKHARPGDDLGVFLAEVFSRANVETIAIDTALLAPLAVAVFWLMSRYAAVADRSTNVAAGGQVDKLQAVDRTKEPTRSSDDGRKVRGGRE